METIEERLARIEQKVDATYSSSEKSRKYLLFILIGSIVMLVLPLILAGLMVPFMMNTLGSIYSL